MPPRVFQIGLHKCGTTSLYRLFKESGIKSVHGHKKERLWRRVREGLRDPLPPGIRDVLFFSDMGSELNFKHIDKCYPGSKFILNTRPREKWIRSRFSHLRGRFARKRARRGRLTMKALARKWRRQWDDRHSDVKEYFRERPGDLLVFNIEKDSPEKIRDFLHGTGLNVDVRKWGRYNKS